MKYCGECLLLERRPSSTAPHGSLLNRANIEQEKRFAVGLWLCVECGGLMQREVYGDGEPGIWTTVYARSREVGDIDVAVKAKLYRLVDDVPTRS